jgi:MFS family permease
MGMSIFSLGPFNGPVLGPLIGGFVFEYQGWRWTNWIVLVLAGLCFSMLLTVKETYAPSILGRKAAKLRQESGDSRWWSQYDRQKSSMQLIKTSLKRPCVLFFTEPIVWFINVW